MNPRKLGSESGLPECSPKQSASDRHAPIPRIGSGEADGGKGESSPVFEVLDTVRTGPRAA
jgi:hypothetical protein